MATTANRPTAGGRSTARPDTSGRMMLFSTCCTTTNSAERPGDHLPALRRGEQQRRNGREDRADDRARTRATPAMKPRPSADGHADEGQPGADHHADHDHRQQLRAEPQAQRRARVVDRIGDLRLHALGKQHDEPAPVDARVYGDVDAGDDDDDECRQRAENGLPPADGAGQQVADRGAFDAARRPAPRGTAPIW